MGNVIKSKKITKTYSSFEMDFVVKLEKYCSKFAIREYKILPPLGKAGKGDSIHCETGMKVFDSLENAEGYYSTVKSIDLR